MMTGKDPVVGQALDLLVPDFEVTPDDLLLAAHGSAARLRGARRRRQTAIVVAFAALLLFAGAAVAAQKYDLFSFLHTNDKNAARFSVDPGRTYHGAAPIALACPGAKMGRFVCHVSGPMAGGTRLYELGMRTDRAPQVTRQSMLDELDHAQGVSAAQVAKVKSDLAAVDDAFIRALAVLSRSEEVGSGSISSNGTERVPPRGVPAWVACSEITLITFRCQPLAELQGVRGGTPLYNLQASRDWRTIAKPPSDNPNQFWTRLAQLLGRKPNAAETRFFMDFAMVASQAVGGSGGPVTGPGQIAVGDPRGAALLAPQSLGLRTRVVSATAQRLPRHLPGRLRPGRTRLYRVVFDLLRSDGPDAAGRNAIYVYVSHRSKLGVWDVAWVGTKP